MRLERWKHFFLAAVLVTGAAAGCDDDEGETGGDADMVLGDTAGDTTQPDTTQPDTAEPDTTDTAEPDTTDTAEPDTADVTDTEDVTDTADVTDTEDVADTADVTDTEDVPVCVPTGPEVSWEACNDGVDNDCDGELDTDEGCMVCPLPADRTADEVGTCDDGLDNDCDGRADCRDFDCMGNDPACPTEDTDALCSDDLDNNGDWRVDCLGRSCTQTDTVAVCDPAAGSETAAEDDATLCGDLLDNDLDGFVDCDDSECAGIGYCATPGEDEDGVSCDDGLDNDGDGRIDCQDSDCEGNAACPPESTDLTCADGLDNDLDTLVDCADPDCYANAAVSVCYDATEDCTNTTDDDFDGFEDCFDPNCQTVCEALPCAPENPQGTCTNVGEVCTPGGTCELEGVTPDAAGQLVINEIMYDPSGINDTAGEWIEIANPSATERFDLDGCILSDAAASHVITGAVIIAPLGFATLAVTDMPGFTPDYNYDTAIGLNNGGDVVTLSCGGVEIDVVDYGAAGFLDPTGASLQLSPLTTDATSNDDAANWCLPVSSYGTDGNLGTPGSVNDVCTL